MHGHSRGALMHNGRHLFDPKAEQKHLHNHVQVRILQVKIIIGSVKRKCLSVKPLKSAGRIGKTASGHFFNDLSEKKELYIFLAVIYGKTGSPPGILNQ